MFQEFAVSGDLPWATFFNIMLPWMPLIIFFLFLIFTLRGSNKKQSELIEKQDLALKKMEEEIELQKEMQKTLASIAEKLDEK